MFEDQDLQNVSNTKDKNTLNNKLVQSNNDQEEMSYQEKLHANKIAEDIFDDTDKSQVSDQKVIKPSDFNDFDKKPNVSPIKPLTNYQDLVQESDDLQSDKIKPHYFVIGLIVVLIVIFSLGFVIYKQFFTGERNSGEIILNTEPEEINLDNDLDQKSEIVEPGVNVNSTAISNDLDGDGLSNEEEEVLKTDPKISDTDEDGLSDREEVKIYHTDPLDKDTDEDGYLDGEEVENGYNPLGAGKLFDFGLITGDSEDNSMKEIVTTKELIQPNIDTSSWSSFESNNFDLSFLYPFDWSVNEEENKIIISPLDTKITDYIEIEIRKNIFELDLVDWLNTQEDYPDFKQDQLKINDDIALVVHSDDPNWKFLSSIFIGRGDTVYNFNFFSEDNSNNGFNIFQTIVLLSTLGVQ